MAMRMVSVSAVTTVLLFAAGCGSDVEPAEDVAGVAPGAPVASVPLEEPTAPPAVVEPSPVPSPEEVPLSARTSPDGLVRAYLERLQATQDLVATAGYINDGLSRNRFLEGVAAGARIRLDSFTVVSATRPFYRMNNGNFTASTVRYQAAGELCVDEVCKALSSGDIVARQDIGNPAWTLTIEGGFLRDISGG